ncbi:MAG: glycosyltransferase family 2 protein [Candidatus Margulisiibacteriota bacterium]
MSLVLPIYNEEACIAALWDRLKGLAEQLVGYQVEIVFVDDGSKDNSFAQLKAIAQTDARVKVLKFSRNFGHQLAITAGMDAATGDAVVVMDADLQDPPELVLEMARHFEAGFDVVYAVRNERHGETWFKKTTAAWFYRVLNWFSTVPIPLNTGDFRLMSRPVIEALKTMREHDRFVRGMVSWVGFKQTPLYFDRDPRVAGETKYPLKKMLKFAINGIVSFSTLPLKCATWLGFILSAAAGVYIVVVLGLRFSGHTFPGYASLMIAILLLGGIQLMTIGILGDYVGRLYMESKKRPLYIVSETVGG